MNQETKLELETQAREIRKGIVTAVHSAKSGHPGGSLSAADIMTYLYFKEMNIDPANPKDPNRDRFVLSKGHIAPALYSTLSHRGYFPTSDLTTLRHTGSYLQGHPDMKHIPGVDMSSGSLGQGLSAAVGMALAAKLDGKDYRVFAMCGDGEIEEGQIWEAAMFASHQHLNNLIAFLDYNNAQIDGKVSDVCSIDPVVDKWESFGWNVIDVKNGNSCEEIDSAIYNAKKETSKPSMIIARTVKGYGVKFAVDAGINNHSMGVSDEQLAEFMKEVGEF